MAATLLDVEAVRSRFSSLRDGGFVFLDAPGGSQVPDEVGDAIARTLREASANIGANYETSKRVERILATAREDGARFLNCSADDVIFGTEHDRARLRALAHRRARLEGGRPDPRLAPRPRRRRRAVGRARRRPRLRGRVGGRDRGSAPRLRRPREPARRARARRRVRRRPRTRSGRSSTSRASRSSRTRPARSAGSTPSSTRRTSRPTCKRSTATSSSAPRTSSAGRTSALAYGRHELLESWRPYKARPAASDPVGRALRAGNRAVRAPRRLLGDDRVPRVDRRDGGDRRLRARARPALPRRPAGRRDRLRAADDGRPRPDVPDQPRGRRRRGRREAARATRASACGRTTTGTRSGCGRSSRTRAARSASASSTTTPRTRSTGSTRLSQQL